MLNSQAATKKIRYCLIICPVIILFTIAQSAHAGPGVAQPPTEQSEEQQKPEQGKTENQLGQKSKQELLDIVQRIIAQYPEIGKELSEQQTDPAVVPEKRAETTTAEKQAEQKTEGQPLWLPKLLGLQFNGIYQNVPGFHSPYVGDHSFRTDEGLGHNITHIYGLYLGSQLAPTLQAYLDIEMAKGSGVSKGLGLGGYTNGDVIRTGSAELGTGPYVARGYLRYFYPLSSETETVERAMDQLPGNEPVKRLRQGQR